MAFLFAGTRAVGEYTKLGDTAALALAKASKQASKQAALTDPSGRKLVESDNMPLIAGGVALVAVVAAVLLRKKKK